MTIQEIEKLKDATNVGDIIRFKIRLNQDDTRIKNNVVEGVVLRKYPSIFELDDGHTYSWVDYCMGKLNFLEEFEFFGRRKSEYSFSSVEKEISKCQE